MSAIASPDYQAARFERTHVGVYGYARYIFQLYSAKRRMLHCGVADTMPAKKVTFTGFPFLLL